MSAWRPAIDAKASSSDRAGAKRRSRLLMGPTLSSEVLFAEPLSTFGAEGRGGGRAAGAGDPETATEAALSCQFGERAGGEDRGQDDDNGNREQWDEGPAHRPVVEIRSEEAG